MHIKLLLVDDSPTDLRLFKVMLTELLANTEITTLGRKCRIEDYAHFDGVILDERIGLERGHLIAREIRRVYPSKPILLLTGEVAMVTPEMADSVDGVLSKILSSADKDVLRSIREWAQKISLRNGL
jgi:CheY-like chemotaxis protein